MYLYIKSSFRVWDDLIFNCNTVNRNGAKLAGYQNENLWLQ